ncbi:MAG TPA: hypothetical protein VGL23_13990 [Chloroflexota bacterium]
MNKYAVVLFRLIAPAADGRFQETGGGVVFFPEPRPESWHVQVAELVGAHFRHPLGPCVEVGVATLDRSQLERHCRRHGDLFWQGGDL